MTRSSPPVSGTPLVHDYLIEAARRAPEKIALVTGGRRYSYGELDRAATALAGALVAAGVARGDRVFVFADNGIEAVISFWATLKANAVVVMIHPQTRSDKLAALLADCRPAALVSEARLYRVLAQPAAAAPHLRSVIVSGPVASADLTALPGGQSWDQALGDEHRAQDGTDPPRTCLDVDLAAVIYTSGSTGEPKGVMLTHRNMLTVATSVAAYLGNGPDDVVLNVLPMSLGYGLYQMIVAFRMGARLVLEKSFAFPVQILQTMVDEQVTDFAGVPTIFAMIADIATARTAFDLSRMRCVTNAAAALPVKHLTFLRELFPRAAIVSMYGQTECQRVCYLPPDQAARKPASVGIAIPNTEVWIVDEQDRRLPPGQVGQLVVRGGHVMRGYWEKPELTAAKLRPGPLPGEQVLYTGDCFRADEEGYLYFVGRMDEIIKTRGEKVAPREVEQVLLAIPGVKEAAVIGVPDELLGQAIKAFLVLREGATLSEQEVRRECQRRIEPFMVPRQVALVSSLPRTASGKVRKVELA